MNLHEAVRNNQIEVVMSFLDGGADLEKANDSGETLLYIAAEHDHNKIVDLLLKNGADHNKATNDGVTALHIAAYHVHDKVVEILLPKYLAMIDEHDKDLTLLFENRDDFIDIANNLPSFFKSPNPLKHYMIKNQYTNFGLGTLFGLLSADDNVQIKEGGVYAGGTGDDRFIIYLANEQQKSSQKIIIKDFNLNDEKDYLDLGKISSISSINEIELKVSRFSGRDAVVVYNKISGEEVVTLYNLTLQGITLDNIIIGSVLSTDVEL